MTLRTDTRGATMVEYLIIVAVVGLAGLGAYQVFGSSVAGAISGGGDALASANAGSGAVAVRAMPPPSSVGGAFSRLKTGASWKGSASVLPRDENRRLARRLVKPRGRATRDALGRARRNLARLPPGVLRRLRASGAKIHIAYGSVVDARPDLRGVRPRGWPRGKTFADVDGVYMPDRREVIVAERHGAARERDTLYHEIGHALDGPRAARSRSGAFGRAYAADRRRLSGYERQRGAAGRSEAYAESFRKYVEGDRDFRRKEPHLWKYWNDDPLGIFG